MAGRFAALAVNGGAVATRAVSSSTDAQRGVQSSARSCSYAAARSFTACARTASAPPRSPASSDSTSERSRASRTSRSRTSPSWLISQSSSRRSTATAPLSSSDRVVRRSERSRLIPTRAWWMPSTSLSRTTDARWSTRRAADATSAARINSPAVGRARSLGGARSHRASADGPRACTSFGIWSTGSAPADRSRRARRLSSLAGAPSASSSSSSRKRAARCDRWRIETSSSSTTARASPFGWRNVVR